MSWIWWLISSCAVLAGYHLIGRRPSPSRSFPPGPPAYPVIGHLHLLSGGAVHQTLADLSRKYEPILGLRLGLQAAVVVSSPAFAKQVLCTHDDVLSNRTLYFFPKLVFPDDIIFGRRSPEWRTRRKLCLLNLLTARRLSEQEHVRQQETAALLQMLHDSVGAVGGVDIGKAAGKMMEDVLSRLLFSQASIPGENLQLLFHKIEKLSLPSVGDIFPWLWFLDFCHRRRLHRVHSQLDRLVTAVVLRRKQEISGGEAIYDDFLQALLSKEVGHQQAVTGQETLTLREIKSIVKNVLAGGIHTSAGTIEWAMAELIKNPKCYKRLQRELDESIGPGRTKQATDDDLPNLPYLNCVLKEVLRLHPALPLLIPRISAAECRLGGFIIPTNTMVFVNVWAMGRDEQVWSDQASQFIPERFEGKDIDWKGQHYEFLPFGSGRRGCVGRPLAIALVGVTLANLVRSFDWELPSAAAPESMNMQEAVGGFSPIKAYPTLLVPKPRW